MSFCLLFSDFGIQMEPKSDPIWRQNPPRTTPKNHSKMWFDILMLLGVIWVGFWSQNEMKIEAKSGHTRASPQKGRLMEYPIETNEFIMFLGCRVVDFGTKNVEPRSKIESEIRPSFWIVFSSILGDFGSHFGRQNGSKMASRIDQKIDGFVDRSWRASGAPKGASWPKKGAKRDSRGSRSWG